MVYVNGFNFSRFAAMSLSIATFALSAFMIAQFGLPTNGLTSWIFMVGFFNAAFYLLTAYGIYKEFTNKQWMMEGIYKWYLQIILIVWGGIEIWNGTPALPKGIQSTYAKWLFAMEIFTAVTSTFLWYLLTPFNGEDASVDKENLDLNKKRLWYPVHAMLVDTTVLIPVILSLIVLASFGGIPRIHQALLGVLLGLFLLTWGMDYYLPRFASLGVLLGIVVVRLFIAIVAVAAIYATTGTSKLGAIQNYGATVYWTAFYVALTQFVMILTDIYSSGK